MDQEAMVMKERKVRLSWRAAALGAGIGLLTMICACAAGAALLAGGRVEVERMGLLAAAVLLLAGAAGCLTALLSGGGPLDGAVTALTELVVLFGLNGVLNGGRVEGAAVTALVLGGGCGAAMLLRLGKGSGRSRRRKKNRYYAQRVRG